MRIPFIGSAYNLRSPNVSAQRCVNLVPELVKQPGKESEVAYLAPTPGLRAFYLANQTTALLAAGNYVTPIRGMYVASDGSLFVAIEQVLLTLNFIKNTGQYATSFVTHFSLAGTGPVSFADNGLVVVMVTGAKAYTMQIPFTQTPLYNGTLLEVTNPAFRGADYVEFIDGYFVFNEPESGRFYISGLYATTFDGLDFATAEGSPDNINALVAKSRELWLFGPNSIEVFYNSGNADFPFQRLQGAYIDYGCAAGGSVVKLDNALFWLAQAREGGGIVVQADGYQPTRISTHAIEQLIQSGADFDKATAYGYQLEGHVYYCLNVPGVESTLVYDVATKEWHEQQFFNTFTAKMERHLPERFVYFQNQLLVSSYKNGALYILDQFENTFFSAPIVRLRSCQHISDNMNFIEYRSFQLDIEAGVGIQGLAQVMAGVVPVAELRWSDDGGQAWSDPLPMQLGRLGNRRQRAIARRLGRSRDRVFEVRITDPVRVTILGAVVDAVKTNG